jgi:hypothetical protein
MRLILLPTLLLLGLLLAAASPAPAPAHHDFPTRPPRLMDLDGTVVAFSADAGLMTVDTRLGVKLFEVSSRTQVLLNNRAAPLTAVQVGDHVRVTFRFDTGEAFEIRIFREVRARGIVRNVTPQGIELELERGGFITLRPDAHSRVTLSGIPLTNYEVLVGRPAVVLYEPGSLLLLSLEARAARGVGALTALDPTTRALILSGARAWRIEVDPAATIRRGNQFVLLTDLRVGERLVVIAVPESGRLRGLAIQAGR